MKRIVVKRKSRIRSAFPTAASMLVALGLAGESCVPSYVLEQNQAGASAEGGKGGGGSASGGTSGGSGATGGGGGACDECGGEGGSAGTGLGGGAGTGTGGVAGAVCEAAGCSGDPKPCEVGPSYPCLNDGVCEEDGAGFTCHCPSGFMGERCELVDPCSPNPCEHGGRCEREPFRCDCQAPYTGEFCATSPACQNSECNDFWLGTIGGDDAEETPLRFEVRGGGLAMVWFQWSSSGCGSFGKMTSTWSVPMGIVGSEINSRLQSDDEGVAYTLKGDFESTSSASGTIVLDLSSGGCDELLPLPWTATRVLCGDGRVDWPETCDDGSGQESAACSSTCQLPVFREDLAEPNDDGTPAVGEVDFSPTQTGGPFNDDTLIFGTLQPAGDEDVFRVTNESSVGRTLLLETHGPGMGTCGIDTAIVVHQEGEGTGATDNDSGIGSCAALSYDIPAQGSVFVRVTEGDDEAPITGYHLAIRFTP